MPNDKQDVSENNSISPGEVLTPEVIDSPQKKKRQYTKSRKGIGGAPVKNVDLDKPVIKNFIVYLIKRKESDREIARMVNVPKASFDRWKKKNIELWAIDAEDDNTELQKVRRSLVERATGGFVERPLYDKVTGQIKGTKFQYYPASDTAIQYYLNNRDPANWKSKVEHNHALEELPVAINFVRASDKKKEKEVKAITDDFGNEVKVMTDENQGNRKS
jgi:hypothetical protein